MDVIIIQPPLLQQNTAYPAGAYLAAFFRGQGHRTVWLDTGIELFHELFCAQGLRTLFAHSAPSALRQAEKARKNGDEATASNLYRYLSQSDGWIRWIDSLITILTADKETSSRELCHQLVFSPHAPRGMRMERYLEELPHVPSTDDAHFLASLALEDLADYITVAFDRNFSLVRYGERLAIQESRFCDMEKALDSPVLTTFYEPVLQRLLFPLVKSRSSERTLVCISIPFAGTFAAGLYTARFLKRHAADMVFISMGGGFVNTELRDTDEPSLANYIDALSYDRGYGSYKAFFDNGGADTQSDRALYKLRRFTPQGCIPPQEHDEEYERFEDEQTRLLTPDYEGIDFSRYPRMIDDSNPMQRLWSDGAWLKAYLAHGCYWHQCAFCDVHLDYVAAYRQTQVERLFDSLYAQAQKHGIYGVHFVDEAMPPRSLCRFAARNITAGLPLSYWGNIRFEKTFSRDVADFLAYGGLMGVSAGIEIATSGGLDGIHKGTDLDSIVGACCAFKEAGILIHAYMIYGYWQETPQDLMNSMETLRQFYAAGLLDSSFWHKFTLTRHSRIYAEWQQGMHPTLHPMEPDSPGLFAKNGMHFVGEEKSEAFGPGLNAALDAWMHGHALRRPVGSWFPFAMPKPQVPADCIDQAIRRYERRRDAAFAQTLTTTKQLFWLGGTPLLGEKGRLLIWHYMDELHQLRFPASFSAQQAQNFCAQVQSLRPDTSKRSPWQADASEYSLLHRLRGRGLAQLPPSLLR